MKARRTSQAGCTAVPDSWRVQEGRKKIIPDRLRISLDGVHPPSELVIRWTHGFAQLNSGSVIGEKSVCWSPIDSIGDAAFLKPAKQVRLRDREPAMKRPASSSHCIEFCMDRLRRVPGRRTYIASPPRPSIRMTHRVRFHHSEHHLHHRPLFRMR
jgi:hypothetical protein